MLPFFNIEFRCFAMTSLYQHFGIFLFFKMLKKISMYIVHLVSLDVIIYIDGQISKVV